MEVIFSWTKSNTFIRVVMQIQYETRDTKRKPIKSNLIPIKIHPVYILGRYFFFLEAFLTKFTFAFVLSLEQSAAAQAGRKRRQFGAEFQSFGQYLRADVYGSRSEMTRLTA